MATKLTISMHCSHQHDSQVFSKQAGFEHKRNHCVSIEGTLIYLAMVSMVTKHGSLGLECLTSTHCFLNTNSISKLCLGSGSRKCNYCFERL